MASISRCKQQLLLRYQVQFLRLVTGRGARLLKKEQYRSGTALEEVLTAVSEAAEDEARNRRQRRGGTRKRRRAGIEDEFMIELTQLNP